jgi:hypothetical protein
MSVSVYFEYWRGNSMRKVVPVPISEVISIVASSKSHKRFTMDNPSPSPLARLSDDASEAERSLDDLSFDGSA